MRRAALAVALSLFPLVVMADAGVWGARGISRKFAVRGDLLLDADGRGLTVYDVKDPAHIQRAGLSASDDETRDLALLPDGGVAVLTAAGIDRYSVTKGGAISLQSSVAVEGLTMLAASGSGRYLAAGGNAGVTVWTTSAGGTLNAVARIPVSAPLASIAFHGERLLMAVERQAVFVHDLDGAGLLATIPINARGMAVNGDTLFAAADVSGLVIADLTNDLSPVILSRTGAGEVALNRVAASGNRVFATEGNDKLHFYDVTSLSAPKLVATVRDNVQVLAASGNRLYVSGAVVDPFGLRNETGIPVRIYDVSNVAAPAITGEYRDLAGPVSGVATDGTLAYVVDPPFFRILDVSTPSNPRELSSLQVAKLQDRVKISGSRAIVYGRGDVDLIDISDPYQPKLLGVFVSFGRPPSNAAFAGVGNTIVEGNPWSGFHVIDFDYFGDPSRPVQIAGIKGHYRQIVGRGERAYLFADPAGFLAVDLAVRGEARVTGDAVITAEEAEVVGETESHPQLLLTSASDGFRVFVSAATRPEQTGFIALSHAVPFSAFGDTAWLGLDGHLVSVDLLTSVTATTAMRVSSPMQIAVASNGKIVVADRFSLRVFGPVTASGPPPPRPTPPQSPSRKRAARH